jgi:hypothetical protein
VSLTQNFAIAIVAISATKPVLLLLTFIFQLLTVAAALPPMPPQPQQNDNPCASASPRLCVKFLTENCQL